MRAGLAHEAHASALGYTERTVRRRLSRLVQEIAATYDLPRAERSRSATVSPPVVHQLALGF